MKYVQVSPCFSEPLVVTIIANSDPDQLQFNTIVILVLAGVLISVLIVAILFDCFGFCDSSEDDVEIGGLTIGEINKGIYSRCTSITFN